LSQNRNQNRRRGRNNRGPGGGSQGNRIDSRARGNAPQMLEKYKKLAHDASLNGDRVQTEFYLQFADHYFRVIADNKVQKDDQTQNQRARHNERDQDDGDDDSDEEDDRPQQRNSRGRPSRNDDRNERAERDDSDESDDNEGARGNEGASDEGDDNPFERENKPRRGRPRKNGGGDVAAGLDPSSLPPSIVDGDERPRRKTRSRKPSDDDEVREAHG
jgi:hypothetical protein